MIRPGLSPWRAAARLAALLLDRRAPRGRSRSRRARCPTTLQERITRSLDSSDQNAQSHLVGDREHLVDAGVAAFLEVPLLGTGLDNFRYVAPRYDTEVTPQLPHNLWLQLLVQVGLVGAAAFAVWIAVWGFDMASTVRRARHHDGTLVWGLFASMAGILTIFMFAPEMLDRHYWLIAALGLAAVRGCRDTVPQKGFRP